jgi:hypothetical protein
MSLPPSRFGAGFTVGGQPASAARPAAHTSPGRVSPVAPVRNSASSGAAPAPVAGMNMLAVVSFVLVLLLGPFIVPVSIPMALIARVQINRCDQSGSGLVLATLVLSVIYLAFGVVVLLLLLYSQTSNAVGAS